MFRNLVGAILFVLLFVGCKNPDVAGTLVETNTGNRASARILISTAALELNGGDTLSLADFYSRIVSDLDTKSGIMLLDSVPVGQYDSVEIRSEKGIFHREISWTVSEDSVALDPVLGANFSGTLSIPVPKEISSAQEIFDSVPALFSVSAVIENPCLLDDFGNLIRLDRWENSSNSADEKFYWGIIPQVQFSDSGTIDMNVIASCQESDEIALSLGRRSEHFENGSLELDTANRTFQIANFYPFSSSTSIGVSFWIQADSAEQIYPYARILGAKKDSEGFSVQQRGSRGSVNLRIDTEGGSYNALFGTAEILDDAWHNYAFTIRNDSIKVYADGVEIQAGTFDLPEPFESLEVPQLGDSERNIIGAIDELIFLSGKQSSSWMRLFYTLQENILQIN